MEILEAAPAARVVTTFLGLGILTLEYPNPTGSSLPAQPGTVPRRRRPTADRVPATGVRQSRDDRLLRRADRHLLHLRLLRSTHGDRRAGRCRRHQRGASRRPDRRTAALGDRGQPVGQRGRSERLSGIAGAVAATDPSVVLCTHLPPARRRHAAARHAGDRADADPFVGPDQAALEALLAGFEPATRAEGDPRPSVGAAKRPTSRVGTWGASSRSRPVGVLSVGTSGRLPPESRPTGRRALGVFAPGPSWLGPSWRGPSCGGAFLAGAFLAGRLLGGGLDWRPPPAGAFLAAGWRRPSWWRLPAWRPSPPPRPGGPPSPWPQSAGWRSWWPTSRSRSGGRPSHPPAPTRRPGRPARPRRTARPRPASRPCRRCLRVTVRASSTARLPRPASSA